MALNMLYKYSENLTRSWPVPDPTLSGDPRLVAGVPCVALTSRGDSAAPAIGGVGNPPTEATVATDGTFILAVTGATTSTAKGTVVYITPANALTLTESTNTRFGVVDGRVLSASSVPVKVGA